MMLTGELMLTRALAVWMILLALAFANGAVCEVWILPNELFRSGGEIPLL
jgi:hypothetical protein